MEIYKDGNVVSIEITIPLYIRTIQLSAKALPVYFNIDKNGYVLKGKKLTKVNKNLFKDYFNNDYYNTIFNLKDTYEIGVFYNNTFIGYLENLAFFTFFNIVNGDKTAIKKYKFLVVDKREPEQPVISNKNKAFKPKTHIISSQSMLSQGSVGESFIKDRVFKELKKFMIPYIEDLMFIDFPITIKYIFYDTIKSSLDNSKSENGRRWDLESRAFPWRKAFKDLLVNGAPEYGIKPKLYDDDRLRVISECEVFSPLKGNSDTERKLVIIINKVKNEYIIEQFNKEKNKKHGL